MKCMNQLLFMVICCTAYILQGSQAEVKIAQQTNRATELEIKMIHESENGTLTKEKLAEYLKQDNFNINAQESGTTALIFATWDNHLPVVQLLIDNHADLNVQDHYKNTALMRAIKEKHQFKWKGPSLSGIIKLLITSGADLNVQDDCGKTALFWAIRQNHSTETLKLLIQGTNLDIQDQNGWTVLMKAANDFNPRVVVLLLEAGANPYIQSYSKETISKACNRAEHLKEFYSTSHGDQTFFTVKPSILAKAEVQKALATNKYVLERQASDKSSDDAIKNSGAF